MESLEILKDNVIILGIEDPRKQIATSLENASNRYRLSQASILEFPVIHLLLTPNNPSNFWLTKKYLLESLLKHTKRSRYARQWSRIYSGNHNFVCHRFISNGYIFELTEWWYWNNALQNELSYQNFNERAITVETTLASFTIKALSKQSFSLLIPDSSKKNNPVRYLLERLSPYEKEVINIINLSNDLLPNKSLKKLINTNIEEEIKKVLDKINKLTTLFSELRSLIIGEYLDGATRCIVVTVHSNEDSIFQTSMKKGKGGWSIEPIYYEFEGKEYKSNITKYTVNNYRFEFIYFSQIIDYMCLEDRLINVKTSLILGKEVKALSSLCFVDNLLNDASNESIKTSDSYWFTRSSILQEGSYLFNLRYKLKTLESEPIETKPVQVNMTMIESNTRFTDIDSLLVSQGKQTEINYNNFINKSGFIRQSGHRKYLPLLVASFMGKVSHYAVNRFDSDKKSHLSNPEQCKIIYLLTSGDEKLWLLLRDELKDFVRLAVPENLAEDECFADKLYFSPRRYIHPARLTIKIKNLNYSGSLPFGFSDSYPFYGTAKAEIERRINALDITSLQYSFTQENVKS